MESLEGNEPRRTLLAQLQGSRDRETADNFNKFKFSEFDSLMDDEEAVNDLWNGLKAKGLASEDRETFGKKYAKRAPKQTANQSVQASQPPQPNPPQEPGLIDRGINFVKGLFKDEPKPQAPVQPLQFESDVQKEQSAQSPVFQDYEAAKLPAIFQTKEAERRTGLTPEQKQQAIEGSSGAPLAEQRRREGLGVTGRAMEDVGSFASGANRAILKTPSGIAKTASEISTGLANALGADERAEDAFVYKVADVYDKWLDESEFAKNFIADPNRTGMAMDLGSGVGQIASMIAAGPGGASGSLAKNPTMWKGVAQKFLTPASGVAFSQVFSSEYENMKKKGESDATAFQQALSNAMVAMPLESIPLINLAERMKAVNPTLVKKVMNTVAQGIDEGTQETIQQIFSNLTNNELAKLDSSLADWSDGVVQSGEVGGIIGLMMGALGGAKRRKGPSKLGGIPTVPAPAPTKRQNKDGSITVTVGSEAEIPEQYRDRARKGMTGTATTLPFGLGKKTNIEQWSYDITPEEDQIQDVEYEPVDTPIEPVVDTEGSETVAPQDEGVDGGTELSTGATPAPVENVVPTEGDGSAGEVVVQVENSINTRRTSLDDRAKALGYADLRQFNTQNSIEGGKTEEEKQLLKDASDHWSEVVALTDLNQIASLNDTDFGTWVKANDVQRNDLGSVNSENDLRKATDRVKILRQRGLQKQADTEHENLKRSVKKADWTIESWKDRFDEDVTQEEIDATNQESKSFNDNLAKSLDELANETPTLPASESTDPSLAVNREPAPEGTLVEDAATGVAQTQSPQQGGAEDNTGVDEGVIKATSDALDLVRKERPVVFTDDGFITGGTFDLKIKAIEGDWRPDVTTPSKIPFLPQIFNVVHITTPKEGESILKSGFKERDIKKQDHELSGVYFTSEPESWRRNERYNMGGKKSVDLVSEIENSGLLYFDDANSLRDFLGQNGLPNRGQTLSAGQMDQLRGMGIKGIVLREDLNSQTANEVIVLDKSIIKKTERNSGQKITKLPPSFDSNSDIAEAYHKAKADGSNPELVKAVEDLLQPQQPIVSENDVPLTKEEVKVEEPIVAETAASESIKPNPFISKVRKGFTSLMKAIGAKNKVEFIGDEEAERIVASGKPVKMMLNGKEMTVQPVNADVVNGFYSPLEKVINETKFDKLPAKQWIDKFAKGEEAKWTGLTDWLSQQEGSVSKADIQQYLKDNRIQVVEVVKGYYSKQVDELYKKLEAKNKGREFDDWDVKDQDEWMAKRGEPQETKFSQYQLEGEKENYKEVLVTMPKNDSAELSKIQDGFSKKFFDKTYSELTSEEKKTIDYQTKSWVADHPTKGTFKSSHFEEPNILVHLRMNTIRCRRQKSVVFGGSAKRLGARG